MALRFTQGWAAALLYILIPSIVAVGFTALVMALVIRTNGRTIITWLVGATVALAFVNPGTTPIGLFPDWLQPFVRRATDIATRRGNAGTGPRRPARVASEDDSHLGDHACSRYSFPWPCAAIGSPPRPAREAFGMGARGDASGVAPLNPNRRDDAD